MSINRKFEELLTLPDYSYLLQELDKSEINFVQNDCEGNDIINGRSTISKTTLQTLIPSHY